MNRVRVKTFLLIFTFFSCLRCLGILDTVAGEDVEDIKKRGKLIAHTSYGATNYFIYRGTFMGFEYDLLSQLAAEWGVKLEVRVTRDMDNIINMLNSGEGDIIAANITVTKEKTKEFDFTDHFLLNRQVLIQRSRDPATNESFVPVRNLIELIGREIHVRKGSPYHARLKNLSEEIGGEIKIVNVPGDVTTEELIEQVSEGKIRFTVADEPLAAINRLYYPNIDIETPISFPQRISWVVRKKSPGLKKAINSWIARIKSNGTLDAIYGKYYKNSRIIEARARDEFHPVFAGRISPYDDLLKKGGEQIKMDWRLLAAIMYQESRFEPNARSWAGACGLMQLMPSTAYMVGVRNIFNPKENIEGGIKHLNMLNETYKKEINDEKERIKFVLAAYNAGAGHVQDARRLAKKNFKSQDIWYNSVEIYIRKLANPDIFNSDIVEYGYCRGEEPYLYVRAILERYENYKKLVKQ